MTTLGSDAVPNETVETVAVAETAEIEPAFQPIDRRQITVSRIGSLIFAAIVGLGFIVGGMIVWFVYGLGLVVYMVAGGGLMLTVLLFWLGIAWPVWEFQRTLWRLTDTGLEIHRGVFWQHKISIPVARVQHADVSQGPLQRQFELGKLTIHTAGTQNASVELDGISHAQAIQLRDLIVNQRKSADVV